MEVNPYGLIALPWYTLAAFLMLAHLWYDFHVQGSYISAGKRSSNLLLSVHALTWTLVVSVPLYLSGILTFEQFAFLLSSHWVMDWWKCHRMSDNQRSLVIDQAVHTLALTLCLWTW